MAKLDLVTNRANRRVDALEQRLEALIKDFAGSTTEVIHRFEKIDKRLSGVEHQLVRDCADLDTRLTRVEEYTVGAIEEEDHPADFSISAETVQKWANWAEHVDDEIDHVIDAEPDDRFVVLIGSFNEGFRAYGPFKSGEANAFVHRYHSGQVMMLQRPK